MKLGYQPPKAGAVRGVLLATEQSGTEPTRCPSKSPRTLPRHRGEPRPLRPPAGGVSTKTASLPVLMLFAMLGGLILNLMPCVFPVLSIKAIGLVEQAKKHPAAVRTKGLVFAAGVISSMLCLAAVLLALRAGGEQIGWGFQLQSPLFVTLLVYLLLAVGLNLSGVFEVGGGLPASATALPRATATAPHFSPACSRPWWRRPARRRSWPPRSAPHSRSRRYSRCAFLRRWASGWRCPMCSCPSRPGCAVPCRKPGAWMDTLKQFFAFPIYASAAWLLWVLAQPDLVDRLGRRSGGRRAHRIGGLGLSEIQVELERRPRGRARHRGVSPCCSPCVLPVRFADVAAASPSAPGAQRRGRVAALRCRASRQAQRRRAPLLVNFTASWCLTCLVNERNAFADSAVQEMFCATRT